MGAWATRRRRLGAALVLLLGGTVVIAAPAVEAAAPATHWVDNDGLAGPADCNGLDVAHLQVQPAVDAAAPGDTIRVCPSEGLSYSGNVNVDKAGLQVLGAKSGVDARNRPIPAGVDESKIGSPSPNTAVFLVSADDVVIDGFFVSGDTNGPGVYVAGGTPPNRTDFAHIRNNVVTGNVFGVYLNGHQHDVTRNAIVDNNEPGAASGNGIYSDQGVSEATIDQNEVQNHANAAVLFAHVPTPQSGVVISRNTMDNRIVFWDSDTMTIQQNTINGSLGSAIYVGGDSDGLLIERNTIDGAGSNAVLFDDCEPVACAQIGANDNPRVLGNVLRQSGQWGVKVWDEGAGFTVRNLIVTNNQLVANTAGGVLNEELDNPIDARRNWWGNSSGPSVWSIGTGQAVSANVDFFPWATNAARTTFAACTKTASGSTKLFGGAGNDILCGTDVTNQVYGGGGNDLILGNGGSDGLHGEAGDDRIIGDRIGSSQGNDIINGGANNDFVQGRGGTDTITNSETTSDF